MQVRIMRRWKSVAALAIFICLKVEAQEFDHYSVISDLIGSWTSTEVPPEEVERLERLVEHPVKINMDNLSRIKESGLFTQYQMASLVDYRSNHGDILSLNELAALDGFGDAFVRKIAPFVSLVSKRLPGQDISMSNHSRQELDMKWGVRSSDESKNQYALKYKISIDESLQATLALSKSADVSKPDAFAGSIFWYFRRYTGKIAVGDFNARFGQGLALWNGMSISGQNKPSSYLKRASALSPSFSYTGNYTFRGLAVETEARNFRTTLMAALSGAKADPGLLPAVNVAWLWSSGQVGLTHYADFRFSSERFHIADMKTSCDIAMTANGIDLFGEIVYDFVSGCVASVAGVVFPLRENFHMAAMLRYYPSTFHPTYSASACALTKCANENGASISTEFSCGQWVNIKGAEGVGSSARRIQATFSFDGAHFPLSKSSDSRRSIQLKSQAEIKLMLTESISMKCRVSERFRTWTNPYHTDARIDVIYYSKLFDMILRTNILNCKDTSFLTYAEGTIHPQSFKISIRSGLFFVDNWEDRIYVYERDMPGSFNVPAFYGNGFWISISGSWRFARWGTFFMRGSMTEYLFGGQKKPGKAELKFMLRFRF